jgi:hypothetical protein
MAMGRTEAALMTPGAVVSGTRLTYPAAKS